MQMEKYTLIYLKSVCLIQVTYTVKVFMVDDNLQSFDTDYHDPVQM